MNKALLVFLVIVIICAGIFYFVWFKPTQESSIPVPQVETVNKNFNLTAINELSASFEVFGKIPVTVDPASLRKNDSAKANDPFYN